MYKLNKYQEKWLQALESGEYAQCQGALMRPSKDTSTNDSFCCLGVAADVLGEDRDTIQKFNDLSRFGHVAASLRLRTSLGGLKDCIEVTANDGEPSDFLDALTELNDTAEWSFSQIAKYIRENPENVFLPQED